MFKYTQRLHKPQTSLYQLFAASLKSLQRKCVEAVLLVSYCCMDGWVGDKTEWDMAVHAVAKELSHGWSAISIDLPAHGDSLLLVTSNEQIIQGMLGSDFEHNTSIDDIARVASK